jgi:hypothetical protein
MTRRSDAFVRFVNPDRHRVLLRVAAPACAAALLAAMLVWSRDFGATWDERALQKLGELIWGLYSGSLSRSEFVNSPEFSFGYARIYGLFVEFASAAAQQVIPGDLWVVRHYVNAVFGWAGVVFAYLMARRLFGAGAAWLAALLLVTMPRYVAESMNNPKDLPFAVLMLVAFYYIVTLRPRYPYMTWPHALKLAAAIALALGVRSMGLVLLGYAALALAIAVVVSRDWNPAHLAATAGRFAVIAVTALLGASAFWPWAQERPLTRPIEAFFLASTFSWGNPSLFMGQDLGSGDLPWYYLPTWIGITVPVVVLAGMAFAFARMVIRSDSRGQLAALWLYILVPSVYAIVRHLTLYDGIRHLFFIVPPMAILAAAGWDFVLASIGGRTRAIALVVLAALVAEPVAFQIRNHPNQTAYFSPVAGGPRGAFARYDMDYWGNCVLQATSWAADQAERATIPVGVASNAWEILAMDIARYRSLFFRRRHHTGYHLDIRLLKGRRDDLLSTNNDPSVVHRVTTADGTPLCVVVRGPAYPQLEERLVHGAGPEGPLHR